jgi:hypothetical protein
MKTLAKWLIAITAFGTLMQFSCAPAYVPNVINTPMLSEKYEATLALHEGVAGTDPQIAFGITEHIGIMLNGSYRNDLGDTSGNYHKHLFIETGAGYFTGFGSAGHFEVYSGGGFGRIRARYDNPAFISTSDVICFRGFIQPTIGTVTDLMEFSFSPRLVFLNLQQDQEHALGVFIEPAVTAKLGYKYIKGVMQLGLSLPLHESVAFFNQPLMLSFGIQFRLDQELFR